MSLSTISGPSVTKLEFLKVGSSSSCHIRTSAPFRNFFPPLVSPSQPGSVRRFEFLGFFKLAISEAWTNQLGNWRNTNGCHVKTLKQELVYFSQLRPFCDISSKDLLYFCIFSSITRSLRSWSPSDLWSFKEYCEYSFSSPTLELSSNSHRNRRCFCKSTISA